MSYIVKHANDLWVVWVGVQDGIENCGTYPSEQEAIANWRQAEVSLNWRPADWFDEHPPHIYASDAPGETCTCVGIDGEYRKTDGEYKKVASLLTSMSKYSIKETLDDKWAVMDGGDIVSVHLTRKAAEKKYKALCKDEDAPPPKPAKDLWDML